MQVSKIKIYNFRSFGPTVTEIKIQKGLTAIIGYNSVGKTTLLEAFKKVFSISNTERTIKKSDFHIPSNQIPEDINEFRLSIEVIIDFEEKDDTIAAFFEDMVISQTGSTPYLRIRLEATWEKSLVDPEGIIDSQLLVITCAEGEHEDDKTKRPFPSRKRPLIQSFYVPAIRKPSEQIRYASGSILFRLLRRIEWSEDFEQEFNKKLDKINELLNTEPAFANVQSNIKKFWRQYHKDKRYSDSKIIFGGGDLESILKKLEVEFSPTERDRPYRMEELGEGYRSLFYLTLVSTLLKIENELPIEVEGKPFLTILLLEEPENHISPHLLGRILKNLKKLAQIDNVQVIISSHTPSIIGRLDPISIRHLRLDLNSHRTLVNEITLPNKEDEAYKYVKEAVRNYPEIYFSRLVIIGEGDSEEIIFKKLSIAYDQDFDDSLISVVPLGGRFVNHIWRLLHQLNIPYITLLDLDRERNGGGWGRIKYVLKQLLNVGINKDSLLWLSDGIMLSDEELNEMHTWGEKIYYSGIYSWIQYLENFDIFFSEPLDLDFMLLSKFESQYKSTAPENGGPIIPNKNEKPTKFSAKVQKAIRATLKSELATAETYSTQEKELMIWYNYLFLGRGKPSTHLLATSLISDKTLKSDLPPVLKRMFHRIKEKITTNLDSHEVTTISPFGEYTPESNLSYEKYFTQGNAISWRMSPQSQLVFILQKDEFQNRHLSNCLKEYIHEVGIPKEVIGFGVIDNDTNQIDCKDMKAKVGIVFKLFNEKIPSPLEIHNRTLFVVADLTLISSDNAFQNRLLQILQQAYQLIQS